MNSYYHRQITREALLHRVGQTALDAILRANLAQDGLSGQLGHPEFHFDDNAFAAGQAYLEEQRSQAISAMQNDQNPLAAWKAFGRLTHTVQDFYAHSNYVSMYVEGHPGLEPVDIEPLDPHILSSPALRSGRVYSPWEFATFLPVIGKLFRYLLPCDAHAWMNLDSPASGTLFEYARQCAVKRTGYEFDQTIAQFSSIGGDSLVLFFTGMDLPDP